jgi:hypothetical protein
LNFHFTAFCQGRDEFIRNSSSPVMLPTVREV